MNIALLAIGKRGYHMAAFNLAASIKHFDPSANILLISDGGERYLHNVKPFDTIVPIDPAHHADKGGKFSPSLAKMHVHSYATKHFKVPYLFLDVDNIALKSIAPIFQAFEGRALVVNLEGKGGRTDAIQYSVWADNETIWGRFGLDADATYYATHTDWWYADTSKATAAIFKDAIKAFGQVSMSDLRLRWGNAIPDELPFGASLSRSGQTFEVPEFGVTFLGNTLRPLAEMKANYYLLSIYGNGTGKTLTKRVYLDFYDNHMRDILRGCCGSNHIYKHHFILRDKWINKGGNPSA